MDTMERQGGMRVLNAGGRNGCGTRRRRRGERWGATADDVRDAWEWINKAWLTQDRRRWATPEGGVHDEGGKLDVRHDDDGCLCAVAVDGDRVVKV